MITKITKENQQSYKALFESANIALNLQNEEDTINTLELYYSRIKDLYAIDPTFSRVPLDEPFFEIDANTRVINVPTEFKKNGISVQGDKAEIVYFTIDRFFETTDLYDPYDAQDNPNGMHAVIQWEVPGQTKNSPSVTGISPAILVDASILKKQNKLVVGWVINDCVTENAGTVKFSVRFYRFESGNLVFNLSTLVATAVVNASLDFEMDKTGQFIGVTNQCEHDFDDFKNRMKNTTPLTAVVDLEDPEFDVMKHFESDDITVFVDGDFISKMNVDTKTVVEEVDGEEVEKEIGGRTLYLVDLRDDGTQEFRAFATAPEGTVKYTWNSLDLDKKYREVPITPAYIPSPDTEEGGAGIQTNKCYYTKDSNDVYSPVIIKAEEVDLYEDTALYEKMAVVPSVAAPGEYWVTAQTSSGLKHLSNKVDSNYIFIPGPTMPSVKFNGEAIEMADPNEEAEVINVILPVEEEGVCSVDLVANVTTERAKDNLRGTWYNFTDKENVVVDIKSLTNVENGENFTYTVQTDTPEDAKLYDKEFTFTIQAERNTAVMPAEPVTRIFRVTTAAQQPTLEAAKTAVSVQKGVNNTVEVAANFEGILSDSFSYQWFKAELDGLTADMEDDFSNRENDRPIGQEIVVDGVEIAESLYQMTSTVTVDHEGYVYCAVKNYLNGTVSDTVYSSLIQVKKVGQ